MVMSCSFPGCQYSTDQDLTTAMSPTLDNHLTMIGIHIQGVHQPVPAPPPPPPPQIQPPPLQNVTRVRPPELRLEEGKIEEPDWDAFIAEWENFKVAGNLQIGTEKHQLGSVLGATRTKVFGRLGPAAYGALTERELLEQARLLVIKRRNKYVHRHKLNLMRQDENEPAIGFETRLHPAARTGKFKKKGKCPVLNCTGEIEIDYTEEMVLDNFIRGLSDEEIKSKVFAMQEEDCTPEKVLRFVEAEELGRSSVRDIRPASDVQQISGYMRTKQTGSDSPVPTPKQRCRAFEAGTCPRGAGCKFLHRDTIRCKFCLKLGHTAEKCFKKLQPSICQLCNKVGHTAEKCRLRSSHKVEDRAATVADQNAIEAEVMNISHRTQSSKTLALKRGGARGG